MKYADLPDQGTRDQGTLVVTIDLEPASRCARLEPMRRLDETTDWLIKTFGRLGIPATWAVADPAHSAATERLLSADVGHELALLGDSSWVGREAGRGRFAKELARRVLGSRAAGISVTSLVPRDVEIDDHVDLLVKYGVTAVRGGVKSIGRRRLAQPRTLHFGLWEVPGSMQLPGQSAWFFSVTTFFGVTAFSGAVTRRGIRQSGRQRGVFHLLIDAWRLAAGGKRERQVLEQALCVARQARDQHTLRFDTLADIVARLSHVPRVAPARSILRSAG